MEIHNGGGGEHRWYRWALPPATVVVAVLLFGIVASRRPEWLFPVELSVTVTPEAPRFVTFRPSSRGELSRILDAAWSLAKEKNRVPNFAPSALPDGMDHLEVEAKKRTFFRSLAPHVLWSNARIRTERSEVRELKEAHLRGTWQADNQHRLEKLAARYGLERSEGGRTLTPATVLGELQRRVDVIPPSLALAQAAIESAWGTSRFARLGNNLFGQWVFSSRGIVPLERPEGESYTLARFSHLGASVQAYMQNLNTLWAYEEFRRQRAEMRAAGRRLDPIALADHLALYSTRRMDYVRDVRQLIRQNALKRFDSRRLAEVPEEVWEEVLQSIQSADAGLGSRPFAPDA